uniref:ADAM metallopeptidase with thrombospondin type 1 motif, 20 n=1 Tax=Nothobranchius kadleci TaxID=1051664 RepID=A0A1A8D361_NOTKA
MIVKLVIIHDEQEGPTVNFNAATTLYNFCVWQQSQIWRMTATLFTMTPPYSSPEKTFVVQRINVTL